MHIKTNVELSSVQIAILAICPLITVVGTVTDALYFMAGTAICLLISQLFCWIFNKYMGNAVKIFVCALTSSFVVVMGSYVAREIFSLTLNENIYFIIFSSVVMSSDFIYFRHKAAINHTIINFIKVVFIYSLILFVFALLKEFLTLGTVFGSKLFGYDGYGFFDTVASDFLLLGMLCVLFDILFRWIDKQLENKSIKYQKYIKTIRDEKAFQYDSLRRQNLLVNDIEINNMNAKEAEKIIQKTSENETITSVEEVLNEETHDEVAELEAKEEQEEKKNEMKKSKKSGKKGGKS